MSEITSIELEALTFTYGEEALTVLQQDPLSITISIAPHTGEVTSEQYVNATLRVSVSPKYPEEAPLTQLLNPQGMSDKRIEAVLSRLQAEAKGLLGEMMLGSLIEAAKEAMTEINQPEGHCMICLEQLVQEGTTPNQHTLLRLPCYHSYHLKCFGEWWHWQQRSMQQKAEQIQKDLQSAAPQQLQDEGLIPDISGHFDIQCPVCRLVIAAQDIQQVHDIAQQARRDNSQQDYATDLSDGFTPKEMQKLMLQQQKRARQFAKQQKQGGIVSERYGTSLTTLTGPEQTALAQAPLTQPDQQHIYDEAESHLSSRLTTTAPPRGTSSRQSRGARHDSDQHIPRQGKGHDGSASEPGQQNQQGAAAAVDRGSHRAGGRGRRRGRGHAGEGRSMQGNRLAH